VAMGLTTVYILNARISSKGGGISETTEDRAFHPGIWSMM
jgi:hypothetical protein